MYVHSEHVNTVTSFPLTYHQDDYLDKITTISILAGPIRTAFVTLGVEKQKPTDRISNTCLCWLRNLERKRREQRSERGIEAAVFTRKDDALHE